MASIIRAARLQLHGQPLRVEPVELPDAGEGDVRVDMAFGGVNPIDRYMAEGSVAAQAPLPRTLGSEGAGTVENRPVLVHGGGLGAVRDGVWARAAVVPRDSVHDLPEGVELRHAAAMGVAGLTAWQVVHELGQVSGEDRVLVLGASGGVGCVIVSLCHSLGAVVWGQTGSQDKAAAIQEDGAERVVVAGPDELGEAIADLQPTVVFDPLGDGFVRPSVEALPVRGKIVSFGTSAGAEVQFNLQTLYRKHGSILGYGGMGLTPEERRRGLHNALNALRDGQLRVRIDEVLPLDQVNDAFRRLVERRVRGNLLLDLS
ncbi:MAG TPA: zinc-binding alcohol dehydrogenase family protein [Solirubrobacteraceae bacterium]|nr:zinc-binding alcohol dehydrogenase family protein [Solirubrobacteraceae bacterium]